MKPKSPTIVRAAPLPPPDPRIEEERQAELARSKAELERSKAEDERIRQEQERVREEQAGLRAEQEQQQIRAKTENIRAIQGSAADRTSRQLRDFRSRRSLVNRGVTKNIRRAF